MNVTRRRFLKTVSAASVLFYLRNTGAQEKSSELRRAISGNKKEARALLAEITMLAPEIDNESTAYFVRRETALRLELHEALAYGSPEDLYSYVLPNRRELADSFWNAGLPLLLEKDEIEAQIVLREEPPERCQESIISVCVDIFMEGLGLQQIATAIKEVVHNSPEIQDKIDALARALQLRDWEQVIDLVATIMDLLSDAGMADLFVKVLGRERARIVWRRLLTKLGARFVPFVGQVYTAITIGVALFNNSDRLLHAAQCSKGS